MWVLTTHHGLGVRLYLVCTYFISSSHEDDQGSWNCYEHVNECNIDKCQDLVIGHFIFGHNIVVFGHGFMVVGHSLLVFGHDFMVVGYSLVVFGFLVFNIHHFLFLVMIFVHVTNKAYNMKSFGLWSPRNIKKKISIMSTMFSMHDMMIVGHIHTQFLTKVMWSLSTRSLTSTKLYSINTRNMYVSLVIVLERCPHPKVKVLTLSCFFVVMVIISEVLHTIMTHKACGNKVPWRSIYGICIKHGCGATNGEDQHLLRTQPIDTFVQVQLKFHSLVERTRPL